MSAKQIGEFVFSLTSRHLIKPFLGNISAAGKVESDKVPDRGSVVSCFEG
jgi:hypothetical protein